MNRWMPYCCCLPLVAHAAGETRIPNYATAQRTFFWEQLYPNGGREFYCNVRFLAEQRLTVEHVYAADWIATHHGCKNRNECPVPAYGFAEADLPNLWPAIGAINSSRGDKLFGEIRGSKPTLPRSVADLKCSYERSQGADAIVEPRRAIKGDIARSLFYMHAEYDLDLKSMTPMLKRWHATESAERAGRGSQQAYRKTPKACATDLSTGRSWRRTWFEVLTDSNCDEGKFPPANSYRLRWRPAKIAAFFRLHAFWSQDCSFACA